MSSCTICNSLNAKYKCSKCRIFYCSINCYKCHQQTPCEVKLISIGKSKDASTYVTEDTVPKEKLKLLDNNEELKNILSNPHVRDILLEINKSPHPNEIVESAMKEPIFVEFADICLKTVDKQ